MCRDLFMVPYCLWILLFDSYFNIDSTKFFSMVHLATNLFKKNKKRKPCLGAPSPLL